MNEEREQVERKGAGRDGLAAVAISLLAVALGIFVISRLV
jgi:hypothetical protein